MASIQIALTDFISEQLAEIIVSDHARNALKQAIIEMRPLDEEDWSARMVRLSKQLIRSTTPSVKELSSPRRILEVTFSQLPLDIDNPMVDDPYHVHLHSYLYSKQG